MYYLPANTTSKLQPLDAGIIKNFKVHYKNFLVDKYLEDIGKLNIIRLPDIKEALLIILKSWDQVKQATITNCWYHCGFLDNYNPKEDDDLKINLNKIQIKLKDIDKFSFQIFSSESSKTMTAEEFTTIDDRECIQSLTDEEILLIVRQPETSEVVDETEKDAYDVPPKSVTFEEVRQSFDTILTFFNKRVYDEKEMCEVNKFKNFLQGVFIANSVQMKLSFKNIMAFV